MAPAMFVTSKVSTIGMMLALRIKHENATADKTHPLTLHPKTA